MILMLDFEAKIPLYEQLRIQIIKGIATGELAPAERLPSVRQLAVDLGINLHTVNKAYSQLRREGFIIIHRQKGVEVNPQQKPGITEDYLESLKKRLWPHIVEAFCRGMKEVEFGAVLKEVYASITKDLKK
jgi:GntR family transcriptional regulator